MLRLGGVRNSAGLQEHGLVYRLDWERYTKMRNTRDAPSRTDFAELLLRREILSGIAEPGLLLAESAVAQRLGVSRVPVREALFALEREGLVEFSGTGRAFVKALTPRDFDELYDLRLVLEPLASRLAAPVFKKDSGALEKNIASASNWPPSTSRRPGKRGPI